MKRLIVFGGWAVPPRVLRKFFGNDSDIEYIDINKIMPKLFDASGTLLKNWRQVIIDECKIAGVYDTIGGWSTGAMFAYAVANFCCPQNLILLSATPCFCRRDDFQFGMRSNLLDQMLAALFANRNFVLKTFYERIGIDYDLYDSMVSDYTLDELKCGLNFLKFADLRPLAKLSAKIKFHHGADDPIIPADASKYFCEQVGGEHVIHKGGHAFFV